MTDDDPVFLGSAPPGCLDTWVTVVRRDTGRPLGVYTANNEHRAGAGTLPDDPRVCQWHRVDVVNVGDVPNAEHPVRVLGWAHYTGGGPDGATAALPPYAYRDLQGAPLWPDWADWDRDAWLVDEDAEALELGGGGL